VTFVTSCHAQRKSRAGQLEGALVEFHILGTVELRLHGKRLELRSDKERIVLAALALEVGRPVALDALVSRLWDDAPPAHASQSVHSYVSRLRGRLREAETDRAQRAISAGRALPKIGSRSHTYVLQTSADSVDWHRFQNLVGSAGAESDERAVDLLLEADALWDGEALAGVPGLWAGTVRRSLNERRLAATLSRTAAQLRLGQYGPLVSELSALAARHPQDEMLLGQLILAYYGNGRFTEALRVHQRLRQTLLAEYGARPGQELNRLHRGILERQPAAELVRELTGLSRRSAPSAPSTVLPRKSNGLPSPSTPRTLPHQPPLVGRHAELSVLTGTDEALPDGSVVLVETVSGMPGVGKTAIVVHTADRLATRFPDGQLYLDLRAHSPVQEPMTAREALTALLRMLGPPAGSIPVDIAGQTSLWRAMMAERRAVVVLDDAANASQIKPLLPGNSPSVVIIASRRHLTGIPHARSVLLDVLPTPDAIELFRSFAGHGRTRDNAHVAQIVQQCGLLPLAIELAANRFRTRSSWTLTTLSDRLSREPGRLGEIRDAENDVARAFDLSYRTLTEAQRTAFRRLSLHPGPDFTADVAAAMLDLPLGVTERILEELLACHLLREPAPDRYRYHDLLRVFARHLATSQDPAPLRHQVESRLTEFYLQAVDRADRLAYPRRLRPRPPASDPERLPLPTWPDRNAARTWLNAERANLLASENHLSTRGDAGRAARLGYALAGHLDTECHWRDASDVLQRVAAHWSQHGSHESRCHALIALAAARTSTGRYTEASEAGEQALEIARAIGDSTAEGEALRVLGTLEWNRGEHQRALRSFQRSFALKQASGDLWETSRLRSNIGVTLLFLGEYNRAYAQFEKALNGLKESGDMASAAKVLNNIGDHHLRNGDLAAARLAFEEALGFLDTAGNRYEQATVRSSLADVLLEVGETKAALTLYKETLGVFQSLGDNKSRCEALIGIGEAHRATGDLDGAITYYRQALDIARSIGAAHQVAQALRCLGQAELSHGQLDSASQYLRSAVDTAARIRDLDEIVQARAVLADVMVASGDIDEARAVLRAALDAIGDQPAHRTVDTIRRHLAELTMRLPGG